MSFFFAMPPTAGVLLSFDILDACMISGRNSIFTAPRNLGSAHSPVKWLLGDSIVD
jgi:hypothetical protein